MGAGPHRQLYADFFCVLKACGIILQHKDCSKSILCSTEPCLLFLENLSYNQQINKKVKLKFFWDRNNCYGCNNLWKYVVLKVETPFFKKKYFGIFFFIFCSEAYACWRCYILKQSFEAVVMGKAINTACNNFLLLAAGFIFLRNFLIFFFIFSRSTPRVLFLHLN